jgi:hypothetical protein
LLGSQRTQAFVAVIVWALAACAGAPSAHAPNSVAAVAAARSALNRDFIGMIRTVRIR